MTNPYDAPAAQHDVRQHALPKYISWSGWRLVTSAFAAAALAAFIVFLGQIIEDRALGYILSTQTAVAWKSPMRKRSSI